jgi:hypothetical protein
MSPQIAYVLMEEVIPRLRSAIPRAVKCVGAEDPEELIQDATCMAANMMERNELKGKTVTPGNVAFYCLLHQKSGRRANGASTVDAMGTGTQLNGSSRLHSIHEVVQESEGEEIFLLEDVISNDHEDPGTQAARKLDWDFFMNGLSKMEKVVVEFLCAGKSLAEAARKVGLSVSTMQYHKQRIAQKIVEFFGVDILQQILQLPKWKINLNCERETVLCRHERRTWA